MMNSTKFKPTIIKNAMFRSGVGGNQGLEYGKAKSKPDKLKPFTQNFSKVKKDLDDKPTTFKPAAVRENIYNASTSNMRGKRTDRDYNGTQPIRFDPLADKDVNKVGQSSFSSGAYRGGEDNKEVGTYEKTRLQQKKLNGGDFGKAKNVLPFPVKIKSNVNV